MQRCKNGLEVTEKQSARCASESEGGYWCELEYFTVMAWKAMPDVQARDYSRW
jgi:hypothetical protein